MSEQMEKIRHSLSHIMALAVQELYPGVKFGIGPAIENGFYYDFEFPREFSSEDLSKIEDKMRELIEKDIPFEKQIVSKQKAEDMFKSQPYKLELIKELEQDKASIYKSKGFVDLCKGPHVDSTKKIPARGFKLDKTAGAYWRGTEDNPMLTRIYGLSFESRKELDEFLNMRKEAKKRDHRILGRELKLFLIDEEFGKGLPLWLPKGALIRKLVMEFALETYLDKGYQPVSTPHIARLKLWKRSGHWDFYRESMYSPMDVEGDKFVVKPMNCPGHVKIYNSEIRSYRDLPLRFTEMGTVYRFEKSGELHGLTRVRGFTQDDAHIFCTPDQLQQEIIQMIDLTHYMFETFGFKDFELRLSLRDPKEKKEYLGSDKTWNLAEKALEKVLKAKKLEYERDKGEAAFYGPKIDIVVKDALGRGHQLSTIQVDFNFPEKFDMEYVDKKGERRRPIMLHRALLGSLERFIGILIEHYGGVFPVWLSPVQVSVIPVGSDHREYARKIGDSLEQNGVRAVVRDESETVSKKIRDAEMEKIPYMLVVGDKEMKKNAVRPRHREKGDQGMVSLERFIKRIKQEIKERV